MFDGVAFGNADAIERVIELAREVRVLAIRCERRIARTLTDDDVFHFLQCFRVDDRDGVIRLVRHEDPLAIRRNTHAFRLLAHGHARDDLAGFRVEHGGGSRVFVGNVEATIGGKVELLRVGSGFEHLHHFHRRGIDGGNAIGLQVAAELRAFFIGHRGRALRQARECDVKSLAVVAQLDTARTLADRNGRDDFVLGRIDYGNGVAIFIRHVRTTGMRGERSGEKQRPGRTTRMLRSHENHEVPEVQDPCDG